MKNLKKISLEDEINREGKQIEDEIRADQELEDIKVSDDLESALFNKIQEYEFDKKVTTIVRKKKRRTYVLVGIAAVLIMMLGSVMTAVGSKSYGKLPWEKDDSDETVSYVAVKDMESKETNDLDELEVYKKIKKRLGFSPVRIMEKPSRMYLENYTIDEDQNKSFLFYSYNGEVIRYSMYMNNKNSSLGQKEVDNLVNTYSIQNGEHEIEVEEYEIANSSEKRYVADFEYLDVHYQIKGVMSENDMNKILENLFFR